MTSTRLIATAALFGMFSSAAFADVTWDAVKKKATSCKDYTVSYKYDGPKGKLKFDYRCVLAGKIRTEILESNDSSKVGTVLVFDKSWNADKVRAKTGGGVITRNLSHKDVTGTPFYQSVFGLILDQVAGSGAPVAKTDGGNTRFEFKTGTGRYNVWANDSGDIVKSERTDKLEKETREFSNVKYNSNPHVDF